MPYRARVGDDGAALGAAVRTPQRLELGDLAEGAEDVQQLLLGHVLGQVGHEEPLAAARHLDRHSVRTVRPGAWWVGGVRTACTRYVRGACMHGACMHGACMHGHGVCLHGACLHGACRVVAGEAPAACRTR